MLNDRYIYEVTIEDDLVRTFDSEAKAYEFASNFDHDTVKIRKFPRRVSKTDETIDERLNRIERMLEECERRIR